jgi:energy-coupling factor transporter ATP-binding protein EcfA2
VRAIVDASIDLYGGEVHALVGENGAGKSTLVKILAGVHRPDSGQLLVNGTPTVLHGPAAAQDAGIAVIYQEPTLFPDLTAAENIFMGRQPLRRGRRIDPPTATQVTEGLLEKYPNLKGIISPTTVGILAAAQVVSTPKWKGKVIVTGLGTPDEMKTYVANGVAPAFILWNPANLGYLAAYAAVYLASKKITGAAGETFTASKLGKYTIGADNTVLLGPPNVFNSSNINNFNF